MHQGFSALPSFSTHPDFINSARFLQPTQVCTTQQACLDQPFSQSSEVAQHPQVPQICQVAQVSDLPHISKASSYQQMPDLGRPSGLCKPVWVGETLVSWENQGVWRSLVELGNLGELSNLNMAYLGRPAGLINCVSWGNFAELENMASTQDQQVPKCYFSRNPGETTWCHLQKNSTTQSQT